MGAAGVFRQPLLLGQEGSGAANFFVRAARGVRTFDPLPKGGLVDLTLSRFSSRAIYDVGKTMKGRTIRMRRGRACSMPPLSSTSSSLRARMRNGSHRG